MNNQRQQAVYTVECNLCLDEKISILKYKDPINLLNERRQFIFKSIHRSKLLI